LIGVDLIDILDDGISAIYFFYDPEYSKLSLGVYSLLYQIELANILDLEWVYLGYWVDGCRALPINLTSNLKRYWMDFPL